MADILKSVQKHRVIMIYRGLASEHCLEASQALMEAGVRFFEVTTNSPDTFRTIRLLRDKLDSRAFVGAGTVTSPEQVDRAVEAGATYIISPNTNPKVIRRTKEHGVFSIPGAFSPTEIVTAWEAGADMVKVFPINVVGAEHIKQIKAPLDHIPLVATGGITLNIVEELFRAGADAVGIGVHLLGKDLVESENWKGLQARAAEFLKAAGCGN